MPNRLLLHLPKDIRAALEPDIETISIRRGEFLYHEGDEIKFAYFPSTALISIFVSLENGSSVEACTVGSDGFVGMPLLFGVPMSTLTAMAQIEGEASRIAVDVLDQHLSKDRRLGAALGAYANWCMSVMAHSAACLAFHTVQERTARWLLMVCQALEVQSFLLTQEFLGIMIGAHRPTVTVAVRTLEAAGLIEHRRGVIRVTDIEGLEAASCECFRAVGLPPSLEI